MEIWFAELGAHPGTSVQEGCRPVLIICNDKGNEHADTVIVIPLTSKIKKPWLPSHIVLTPEVIVLSDTYEMLFFEAMLLIEQIVTIDKKAMLTRVGAVSDSVTKQKISKAIRAQLGVEL